MPNIHTLGDNITPFWKTSDGACYLQLLPTLFSNDHEDLKYKYIEKDMSLRNTNEVHWPLKMNSARLSEYQTFHY